MTEVKNERKELIQPIGSLFWRKRSYGQRFYLKVTTHRGCKEPGYYTWGAWADPSKVRAYLEGKISLGVFDSEESAREACESHYLANVEVIHGMKEAKNERNELASPTGSDQVRVGEHYCIDGVKHLVTLVHLGEAILTSRCGKLRIEKCSWILSQND